LIADLRAVRALLDSPSHWTRECSARRADGTPTTAVDPAATSFCLLGAVARVCGTWYTERRDRLHRAIATRVRRGDRLNVSTFNDRSTHQEVLDLLDETLAEVTE
jgi:hypothetical protein